MFFFSYLNRYVTSSFYMGTDGPGTETKTLGLGAPDQSTNVGLDSPSFYLGLLQPEINSNILPLDRKVNKHHKPTLNRNNIPK